MPKPPQEGPNPLFTRWLEEWRDQAEENGRLKSQRAYERALSSLRKYPLPLRSGREARILMYFGEKICRGPIPTSPCKDCEDVDDPTYSDRPVLPPALSSLEPVQYQEQHSKKPESRDYLTKPELQKSAQPLCDKSFFLVASGDFKRTGPQNYFGFANSFPTRYCLTEAGLNVARELRASEELEENNSSTPKATAPQTGEAVVEENDGSSLGSENSGSSPANKCSCERPTPGLSKPQFVLRPGQFDVILCVDFIETTGGPASRKQELVRELQRHNVPFSIRKLHVGDFLWVAKERGPRGAELLPPTTARELVLDYVVERKRMPDLCGSIIDGRFREQKAQTVYEVFARQLMQVSGLSGEKAAAILEKYKTPASLMGAYAACPDGASQEHLLSTIKCGQLQRNLGPSLSKTLAQLYCTPGPLP
ncbi:hypothetical protein E2320_013819 [Naja naja]|nr:hypothetical protein E2320_013819 [Naja naja]